MSGYPPPYPDPSIGFPGATPYPNHPFPSQHYPPNSGAPTSPSYPYSIPVAGMMSGDNSGYPGPGIQVSPGYPGPNPVQTSPGYPGPGIQVSPGYPGSTPVKTSGGYPSGGTYPNAGGYPNNGGGGGGYPNTGNMPNVPPAQVCPSAPDISQMEKIPGYERITFEEAIIMPPSMPVWQPEEVQRKPLQNFPTLTEDEVRDAAVQYASENCCYGSGAAKNLVITHISMMSAFHYKLETFGEKRESAWRFEPYKGQAIDGPMNGPPPQPWDIASSPRENFRDSKVKMEVPHTAYVKPCHTCIGNGRVRCEHCHGNGGNQCTWCKGRGVRSNFDNEQCTSCNGTGRSRCTWCDATGHAECKTCRGRGQLKAYVELIITWTNHVDDYISETSKMPKELVRQVTGQVAFEEEYPRVLPIMHAPDQAVRNASEEYVNRHSTAFPNERILKQKQVLRLIPISEVNYVWNEKSGVFYVYGYEHKVYFVDYPQKCCCCTII